MKLNREPKHRVLLDRAKFVPELDRNRFGPKPETEVHLEVKRYRCPVCKKRTTYYLVNGIVFHGVGGCHTFDSGMEVFSCGGCSGKVKRMITKAVRAKRK